MKWQTCFSLPNLGLSFRIKFIAVDAATDRRSQPRKDALHADHAELDCPSGLRSV